MTGADYVTPAAAARSGGRIAGRVAQAGRLLGQGLADAGLPPRLLGHRYRPHVRAEDVAAIREEIHPARHHPAQLPVGMTDASRLSTDPGWFGFARSDVPNRALDATEWLDLGAARILSGQTPDSARDFFPAILDGDGRSLDLREIEARPLHAALARRAPDLHLARATWVAERVFDNYSHWLTAHLPRLVWLRDHGRLGDLVLPDPRPSFVDESLSMLGVDPAGCSLLPRGAVLATDALFVLKTDRFRPELLQGARSALAAPRPETETGQRIFVSRAEATGRKLRDETELAPVLDRFGFTPVVMERLSLDDQISLMAETRVLLAPHGAGLSNMLFCHPGTTVVEIADPAYPNPNFYAMAAGLDLAYALIDAEGLGRGHPLHRDLRLEAAVLQAELEAIL